MTHIHHDNVVQFVDQSVRVFLDGTEMDTSLVTEANEEAGYLVMSVPGKDNVMFVDPRTDDIREVKLFGRVDITFNGADLSPQQYAEIVQLFQRKKFKVA